MKEGKVVEDGSERERRQDHIHLVSHCERLSFYSQRDGKPPKGPQHRRAIIQQVFQRIRPTMQQDGRKDNGSEAMQ